jgi:hypothetical protein
MAGFGAYRFPPVFQQLTARLRRLTTTSARPAAGGSAAGGSGAGGPGAGGSAASADPPAKPFKPRGRTHYSDATTTVIGRTLTSPNGTFRIADLDSYRPVPQVEPRERAKDAAGVSVFVVALLAATGTVTFGIYQLMASKFGDATAAAILGTIIVSAVILAAYVSVVLARWRVVYDRDPVRYRHVIVAVHRGESVAITPDLPYEAAGQIVAALDKVKRRIPKAPGQVRREAAA